MTTIDAVEPWIPGDTFGSRLLRVRKEKRLTVEAVAKLCGVAHPTWTTWENGSMPRDLAGTVQKIAVALGVDRDWLMWGDSRTSRNFRSDLIAA